MSATTIWLEHPERDDLRYVVEVDYRLNEEGAFEDVHLSAVCWIQDKRDYLSEDGTYWHSRQFPYGFRRDLAVALMLYFGEPKRWEIVFERLEQAVWERRCNLGV